MSQFAALMRRVAALRRAESDPVRAEWFVGYVRGLRRAHYGENFGSPGEHEMWMAATESDDPRRAALGCGYHAGLAHKQTMQFDRNKALDELVEASERVGGYDL